jgi:hypothetical protein
MTIRIRAYEAFTVAFTHHADIVYPSLNKVTNKSIVHRKYFGARAKIFILAWALQSKAQERQGYKPLWMSD